MPLLDAVRLLLSILLLATASLAVVTAPTHFLWMVAVGVTELGQMFALICLGIIPIIWSDSWAGKGAAGMCVAAAVLASTPVLRAIRVDHDLPAELRPRPHDPHLSVTVICMKVSRHQRYRRRLLSIRRRRVKVYLWIFTAHGRSM